MLANIDENCRKMPFQTITIISPHPGNIHGENWQFYVIKIVGLLYFCIMTKLMDWKPNLRTRSLRDAMEITTEQLNWTTETKERRYKRLKSHFSSQA